uniref:Ovule protein n=1 Tax=Heterorhabditis bacteriophora TaxID=37862 RepID=A0A1I7WM73_HETBA
MRFLHSHISLRYFLLFFLWSATLLGDVCSFLFWLNNLWYCCEAFGYDFKFPPVGYCFGLFSLIDCCFVRLHLFYFDSIEFWSILFRCALL